MFKNLQFINYAKPSKVKNKFTVRLFQAKMDIMVSFKLNKKINDFV